MAPEEHEAVESAFIAGFRHARDQLGFLRLARIPFEVFRARAEADAGRHRGYRLLRK